MTFHWEAYAWYLRRAEWQQTTLKVALVILVGYLVLHFLRNRLDAALGRVRGMDETVRIFLVRAMQGTGWILLTTVVLRMLGVDVTALLGGLAIGGFVLGFALKDTLGNLAAGLMLLFYRPFKVGDVVMISSHVGRITEVGMALTTLQLFDGRTAMCNNASVLSGVIVNFTRTPTRRVDAPVSISYSDSIDVAIKAMMEAFESDPRILKDPAPNVVVTDLADSGVNLEARVWVNNADFGPVLFMVRKMMKDAVESAGCTIPFPQRDVHHHGHAPES